MKPLLALTLAVATSFASLAQTGQADSLLRPEARVLPFQIAIDAVLGDFPFNLRHLTGAFLMQDGESDDYASLVTMAEAEKCVVMRYHSMEDSTASWQAIMLNGDDFAAASRKYRDLYALLRNCYVRLPDSTIYFLKGTWAPAREDVGFSTSTFRVRTDDERFRNVKVELAMVYQVTHWAISINIMSREDEDAVGASDGGTWK